MNHVERQPSSEHQLLKINCVGSRLLPSGPACMDVFLGQLIGHWEPGYLSRDLSIVMFLISKVDRKVECH